MGMDVIKTAQTFFMEGVMLPKHNIINIALIPKVDNQSKVSQFISISLCNVIYKLISKIILERLKKVIPKLISSCQLALYRVIQDNYIADFSWHES